MIEGATCPVCCGTRLMPLLRIEDAPVSCNHLCATRDAAIGQTRAEISLCFCQDCGHVFNSAYDAAQLNYAPGYENSLSGSERFRRYDKALVSELVERYQLRGRTIVEIGCGRGEFLRALCERGGSSGIGFDPSYHCEENGADEAPGVVILPRMYGGQGQHPPADFICCRQTLEHVGAAREFLSSIRKGNDRPGTPVFFEVPNGLYTLRDGGIWDIIYEHCSYFTPSSLAQVFQGTGFEDIEVAETFAGQFLTIHAKTGVASGRAACAVAPSLGRLAHSFAQAYRTKIKEWASKIVKLERQKRRIVVWGAGAKATTFLNVMRPERVEYVVDVNPRKHNKYVAGTGQMIVPPELLRDYDPHDIICMNPNYIEEIGCQIRDMGLRACLMCA